MSRVGPGPGRTLVTGGSGFVGRVVVDRLLACGHAVTATSRSGIPPEGRGGGVEWVPWDALTSPLPEVEWRDLDAIVHLALPASPFDFPSNAREMFEVSVGATFRLLERARRSAVGRLILASTGDVLGHSSVPMAETQPIHAPASFYGAAKACGELLAAAHGGSPSVAVVRFFHPYGPDGERFLVNRLVDRVLDGLEVWYEGVDGMSLNPVWVEDLAQGVVAAVGSDGEGVFHLAGEGTTTMRELIGLIGELAGVEPQVRRVGGEGDVCHVGDCERSRRLLGYAPSTGLREGLSRLIAARGRLAGGRGE